MARTRPFAHFLFSGIALVMLVQTVVAGPVCRCAAPDAAMPCHAPVETAPKGCCQDAPGAADRAAAASLDCCRMGGLDDANDVTALLPAPHQLLGAAAAMVPAPLTLTLGVPVRQTPPGRLWPERAGPVWLRNSVLLI